MHPIDLLESRGLGRAYSGHCASAIRWIPYAEPDQMHVTSVTEPLISRQGTFSAPFRSRLHPCLPGLWRGAATGVKVWVMRTRTILLAVAALLLGAAPIFAADIAGTWTAAIDTQIGVQNYTYTFQVENGKLTGTAKSQFGETKITEGSVKGDDVTFVENLDFQGQSLRIVYTGKVAGDEIKFNRKVGDLASEDFVAKRSK